ncbi:MAG: orotidine-5'-phosphate decarboxylase [Flavobacteriales bacterium]|nr:orotidine-5'-phosphate decarboxylase [Flavobacteriales bacterium]MBK6548906.1 orotidine-5'-phosphate decarboxylase [Flavobacteriales bacterium]MBK6884502.1 orotidine-5'-phosphate decarboxylase [Flavobacteriales bacterium]MBK7100898.1 orotidine-5'-phosphate decarboxylase [Flavobacteriales bacterium]MBK7111584.1 orotidine-5'-phosphate decarboxylase [Flavobacteriales bacterium]
MNRSELISIIRRKRSMLCVGLDTEEHLVPEHFKQESHPVRAFNEAIVEVTHDLAVAYKLNLAFYEALGDEGWLDLEATIAYIRSKSDCFIIADAKRGDIGNTARKYAEAFFDTLDVDAVTLSPYMGRDSITPFLGRNGKWAVVLGVTSNPGAEDFQFLVADGKPLYEHVIQRTAGWGSPEELMFVVGATRPGILARIRTLAPEHFFLVPGVGAQGGDLEQVLAAGMTVDGGLLINSSRGILYAGQGKEAISSARRAAQTIQASMARALATVGTPG